MIKSFPLCCVCITLCLQHADAQRTVRNFSLVKQTLTWNDAYLACQDKGGGLAEPSDEAVDRLVKEFLRAAQPGQGISIGLAGFHGEENYFQWISDCRIVRWSDWDPADTSYADKYCVKMKVTVYLWRHANCDYRRFYMCEFTSNTICPYSVVDNSALPEEETSVGLEIWTKNVNLPECQHLCTETIDCWAFQVTPVLAMCTLFVTSNPVNLASSAYTRRGTSLYKKECFTFDEGEPWKPTQAHYESLLPSVKSCPFISDTTTSTSDMPTTTLNVPPSPLLTDLNHKTNTSYFLTSLKTTSNMFKITFNPTSNMTTKDAFTTLNPTSNTKTPHTSTNISSSMELTSNTTRSSLMASLLTTTFNPAFNTTTSHTTSNMLLTISHPTANMTTSNRDSNFSTTINPTSSNTTSGPTDRPTLLATSLNPTSNILTTTLKQVPGKTATSQPTHLMTSRNIEPDNNFPTRSQSTVYQGQAKMTSPRFQTILEDSTNSVAQDTSQNILYNADLQNSSTTVTQPESSVGKCFCHVSPLSVDDKRRFILQLLSNLSINKTKLSSHRRKRNSIKDHRPSATAIGYGGTVTIAVVLLLVLFNDLSGHLFCNKYQ